MTDRADVTTRGVVASSMAVVRRRWAWSVGVAFVVAATTVAVVFLSRPVYRADARLRLGEPPPAAGISPTGGLLSFLRTGGDPFANDLELLASRTLAESLVRTVALSVRLDAPRGWTRDSLMVGLTLADTTAKAMYEVEWTEPGLVRVRQRSPENRDVGSFAAGEVVSFGGMRVAFSERKPQGPESIRLRTVPFGDAVRSTSGRLDVTRTRRDANVLEISYAHSDPGVALAAVEGAVTEFLRLRTRLFQRESGETVDSLRAVARNTLEELRGAEDALESFQRVTGLVALDPQSEALVERYEQARTALEEARAERDGLDAQMARVEGLTDPVEAWSVLVAHPRFLENETVGNMLTRLTELEERRTELRTRLRPEAQERATLDQQIRQLDQALRALVGEYRTSLEEGIDELAVRVDRMDATLATLPGRLVELGRRQREVRVLSEILVLTEQRLRQEELRQALAFSNVQVIDEPGLRFRPVWPRKKLGLAAGLLLAMAAGTLAMVLVERADTTVRSAQRIRQLASAPVLAAPVAHHGTVSLNEAERSAVSRAAGESTLVACPGLSPALADTLADALAESVRRTWRIDGFAAASALAADHRTVVVAVKVGRTTASDLANTASLLAEAGVTISGTVAVCGSSNEVEALWR